MESYQKAKVPPPVPPKYRHLITPLTETTYQKENSIENYHDPGPVTGGALIQTNGTRVKIHINPENPVCENDYRTTTTAAVAVLRSTSQSNGNAVKININGNENTIVGSLVDEMLLKSASCNSCATEMVSDRDHLQKQTTISASGKYLNGSSNGYFCNSISSGQSSPSDNLDSGTCSDVDAGTPPPFGSKKNSTCKTSSSAIHQRSGSVNSSGIGIDSDEEDNVSCDSINSSEYNGDGEHTLPIISAAILKCNAQNIVAKPAKIIEHFEPSAPEPPVVDFHAYTVDKLADMKLQQSPEPFDDQMENTDRFLHFHLNENNFEDEKSKNPTNEDDDSFAGFKSIQDKNTPAATIRSAKGTVRGVKNRVRAGIATFLNNQTTKSWQEKEAGKVVMYTTTMGIVRETYHRCLKVKQILRTHLVKFEEKDVFMSRELQKEIRERMKTDEIAVPQVFVEGILIGDAETIDRLNESGELRKLLKPYKSADALNTCQVCGGYHLLPCNMCNGSKKSVYRNNFSTEMVTLKCMNCDEVGLVKCYAC
ncbi:glutaredoxin domain-containing cysteine-rich protein CG12206-like [Planococcus citri]|uniref:glutaredoxin domain-containing cysteine-rich protein CG12206-like n=1 Tax=Planococcus citri TaxID=170843 RepID=UPI0031F9B131